MTSCQLKKKRQRKDTQYVTLGVNGVEIAQTSDNFIQQAPFLSAISGAIWPHANGDGCKCQ